MFYAGIGSRETPADVLARMTRIATYLATLGYTLRSGGADGADTAFENGSGTKQIFTAKDATYDALALAEPFHPAWHRCSEFAKKLHARNAMIVLGAALNDPVQFVVCWTKDGGATGGTGQALRMAAGYGIPEFNLFYPTAAADLYERLKRNAKAA